MSKSKQYELLRANRDVVEKAICTNLKWIVQELCRNQMGVLTDGEYGNISNPRHMSEKEKAGFVCKHLLQRVDQDPEALRTFVKILMKRQAEFRPVIRELGGGAVVDLPMLNIIKWRDESGVNHRLRLLEEMSAKWEEWGKTVGINAAKLKGFKMQYHYNYKDCMGAAVRVWLQMDSKQYPSTWEGLISLLEAIGMEVLVNKIRQAAADPDSNLPMALGADSPQGATVQEGGTQKPAATPQGVHGTTAPQNPILRAPVTLQRLNIIKWRDENGVNHRFSLLEEMSAKWEEWGKTVGIGATKLDIIKKQYHTNRECMSAAVRVWLQMNSREYPNTWEGLILLLGGIGMDVLVTKILQAAADPDSNLSRAFGADPSYPPSYRATIQEGGPKKPSQSSSQGGHGTTAPQGPILRAAVTFSRLSIIKWRDENGADHKLRLLQEMSVKWKEWGETVGISAAKLDGFERQYHFSNKDCMGAAAREWLQIDSREHPATWEGLISLLEDIGMDGLVSKIRQAAADPDSNLHKN